ncbi:MAG: PKD domain-containing protein [Bacteroidota bacterium]|nr:PKD domain-containing protein [Bacteroidota bacterium]
MRFSVLYTKKQLAKEQKHIEDLFRESFSSYELTPRTGLWKSLSRKLMFREFLSFSASQFNVYYLGGILTLGLAGVLLLTNPKEITQDNVSGNQNSSVENKQSKRSLKKAIATSQSKSESTDLVPEGSKSTDKGLEQDMNAIVNESGKAKARVPAKIITDDDSPGIQLKAKTETTLSSTTDIPGKDLLSLPSFSMSTENGCPPLSVQFYNSSVNAQTYQWQFGDGATSVEKEPSYIFDEPGKYTITLTITDRQGKLYFVKDSILVFSKPKASFEIYPEDIAIPDDPVNFHNYSQNAVRYEWDFGDGNTSGDIEPVHYYREPGTYNITLTAWSQEACYDTLVVLNAFANAGCEIRFPNAFTPNINGPSNGYYMTGLTTNEVFHPVCKGVVEYQLRIFNRYGTLLFESNDVNIGWDGYINDHLANAGVYIWKARGRFNNGESFTEFGNVTLIKR